MVYLVCFVVIVLVLVLIEVKARKHYQEVHGLPYVRKQIAEYPYNEFIEECGSPLNWKLKPGYGKGQMHVNSLGLRCAEPEPGRRRIWVVGESDLFGPKLVREQAAWFNVLQEQLDDSGHDFQVMNASVIGYNVSQSLELVRSLPIAKGDIVLVRPNTNDVSIAYIKGEAWKEGDSWPLEFVHKLERHKAWYLKAMDLTCMGMFLRRKFSKDEDRSKAFKPAPGFQWERLLDYEENKVRSMVEFARQKGAGVAMFDAAPSYGREVNPDDESKLSAIQSNWEGMVKGWSHYIFGILDEGVKRIGTPMGLPLLKVSSYLWNHPRRYLLYLDLVHFNIDGHRVMAQALYEELVKSKLLTHEKNQNGEN
ncbi:MAG: hypothetical protein RBQ72_08685 [Desulfobacterium sp.]|jgi:hypothetical protein|nr:hypothetical protein [Desulfobacterium sp.]